MPLPPILTTIACVVIVCAGTLEAIQRRDWRRLTPIPIGVLLAVCAFAIESTWAGNCLAIAAWLVAITSIESRRARSQSDLTQQQLIALHDQLVRYAREEATSSAEASFMRFSKFAQLSPVGIFEIESDGRLRYSNARFRELIGDGPDDWSRSDLLEGVAAEQRATVAATLAQSIDQSNEFEFEFKTRHQPAPNWLLCRASPQVSEDNELLGFIGTLTDTTDRRAADEARRALEIQTQSARRLESLRQLAGGVAHHLNNLLVLVVGTAAGLRRSVADSPEATRQVGALQAASQRAAELAGHMLLASGRAATNRIEIDLAAEAESIGYELQSRPELGDVEFRIEPGSAEAFGDRQHVRELLVQLLRNAAESYDGTTDAGRVVEVAVGQSSPERSSDRSVFVSEQQQEGDYAWVEVRDHGVGMTEDIAQRLFDPYYSTKNEARGLGLALVLGIIRSHFGAIDVDSTPGAGTRVRVYLPKQAVTAKAVSSPK